MNWDSDRVAGFMAREQRRLEQDIKRMKDQMAYDPDEGDLSEPIAEADGQLAVCAQLKASPDLLARDALAARVEQLKSPPPDAPVPRHIPRTRDGLGAYKRGRLKMIKAIERNFLAEPPATQPG
ncbi:MAG TPA: hypothetical protein VGH80_06035 [Xanthomonadaceae bacterium]|jgi:hypothetical protein